MRDEIRTRKEPGTAPEGGVEDIGLGGGGPGLAATIEVSDGLAIIALANLDPPVTTHLARRLLEALNQVRPGESR